MRLYRNGFAAALVLLTCPLSAAPTTGTLEPGQAEAMEQPTAPVILPSQWSHPEVEARGVWITGAELMESTQALTTKLDAFQKGNFNEVMLDTWFRGYVTYPDSDHAPLYPDAGGSDVLAWIIPEIHKRGMKASAWPSYGFYAYYVKNRKADPSMGPVLSRQPELAAVNASGSKALHNPTLGDFFSLCPSNPRSHQFLARLFTEQMKRYRFDGLNLDRMRYPSEDYCYCSYCSEHFQKDTGLELKPFAEGTPEAGKFLEWKREQNARGVATVVQAVRSVRPDAYITAYVVGPAEKDSKAQSWDLWMKRGLLDAVAVSMYGAEIDNAARRAIELLGGPDKLICAINAEKPGDVYLRNVEQARTYTRLGQYTWYSQAVLDDIEGLARGPYSEPAKSPFEGDPAKGEAAAGTEQAR